MPKRKHLFTKKGRRVVRYIRKTKGAKNPYAVATARVKGARLKPSRIKGGRTRP